MIKHKHLLIFAGILCYVAVGSILFPSWWYGLFFEGGIFNPEYISNGIFRIFSFLLLDDSDLLLFGRSYGSLLIVVKLLRLALGAAGIFVLVLLAVRTEKMDHATIVCNLARRRVVIPAVLFGVVVVIALLYGSSTGVSRKSVDRLNTSNYVLEPPVSFRYVNESVVRRLFNQTAPELVIASARLEQEGGADAAINAEAAGIGSASISRQEVERRTLELKARAKSPERMAIELVNFISAEARLESFDASKTLRVSHEEKLFIKAKVELESRNVVVDENSFAQARDQLRQDQIASELARSEKARGFSLVQARFTKSEGGMLASTYLDSSVGSISLMLVPGEYDVVKRGATSALTVFGAIEGSSVSNKDVKVTIDPIAIW